MTDFAGARSPPMTKKERREQERRKKASDKQYKKVKKARKKYCRLDLKDKIAYKKYRRCLNAWLEMEMGS